MIDNPRILISSVDCSQFDVFFQESDVTQRNHMLWSGIYLTARYSGPSLSACDLEGWFSKRLAPCVSWLKPSESLKY